MTIVYAAVADPSTIIIQCSKNPVIDNVVQVLLQNIDFMVDHKKSFSGHPKTRGHTIQYVVDDEVCFVSAATEGFPQRICFAFLERIKNEWFANYHGKNKAQQFKRFLDDEMHFFSHNPDADKLRGMQAKVDDITNVMHENVDKLLIRGAKIESIEQKADDLRIRTQDFGKKAKKVRCAMCMENCKMWIILIVVAVVCCVILLAVIGVFIYLFAAGILPPK